MGPQNEPTCGHNALATHSALQKRRAQIVVSYPGPTSGPKNWPGRRAAGRPHLWWQHAVGFIRRASIKSPKTATYTPFHLPRHDANVTGTSDDYSATHLIAQSYVECGWGQCVNNHANVPDIADLLPALNLVSQGTGSSRPAGFRRSCHPCEIRLWTTLSGVACCKE